MRIYLGRITQFFSWARKSFPAPNLSNHHAPSARYQFQTTECGVAALGWMLAHFGKTIPLEDIRVATGVSRDCMNAADMVAGARAFGLDCKVRKCEPDRLKALGLPLVVYLNFIHFNVVEEITDTTVRLIDPHSGRLEKSRAQFDEQFTGITLTFAPTAEFRRPPQPFKVPWLMDTLGWQGGAVLALPVLAGLATTASALAGTLALSATNGAWVLGGLGALAATTVLSGQMRVVATGALQRRLERRTLNHCLSLPPDFFAYRIAKRLVEIVYTLDSITRRLGEDLLPSIIGIAGLPLLLGGLWWVHAPTAGALLGLVICAAILGMVLTRHPRWRHGKPTRASNDVQDLVLGALNRIETWKTGRRARDVLMDVLDEHATGQAREALRRGIDIALGLCRTLLPPMALALAGLSLLPPFHAGTLTGAQALAGVILSMMIAQVLSRSLARLDVVRPLHKDLFHLHDLMGARPQAAPVRTDEQPPADAPPNAVAVLSDIHFGHSRRRPMVLKGIDLWVERGEQLGITGPSGGGKSTLARLIAGVEQPWSGRVHVAGQAVPAWLGKTPHLFEASLRDNLTLWNPNISDARIWSALEDVQMADVIRDRNSGLNTLVARTGENFSGGQLQRLEIARSLLAGATLLVIDEGLDSLNPELEALLRTTLRHRGLTLVIVSHRRSTLAACDRVLTVAGGCLVDGLKATKAPRNQEVSGLGQTFGAANSLGDDADTGQWPLDGNLSAALRFLAEHFGTDASPAPTTAAAIADLGSAYGFDLRTLRFVNPAWWRMDGAPMLLRERATGRVMVLLPSATGPVLYDPTDQSRHPFPQDPERVFDNRAYRAYPLFPETQGTPPLQLITTALRPTRGDLLRALSAVLAIGVLSALWPVALSGAASGQTFALGALALIGALACLETAALTHERRAGALVEHGVLHALARRICDMPVAHARASQREDLAAAAQALPRLIGALHRHPVRDMAGAATAAILLGYAAVRGGPETIAPLLIATAAAAFLTLWSGGARLPVLYRARHAQAVAQRFLLVGLEGIQRFRALGGDRSIAGEWQRRQRGYDQDSTRDGRLKAFLDSILALLPWVGLAGVAPWQGGPLDPVLGIALWLAGFAAGEALRALASWLDIRCDLRDMAQITAAPKEPSLASCRLTGPETGPKADTVLDLKNVGADYRGAPVLKDINLTVEPGKILAIAGASGSGKSTLLDVVLGFHPPSHGTITLDGQSRDTARLSAWRARTGIVLQTDRLETAVTIRTYLAGHSPLPLRDVWRLLEEVNLAAEVAAMPMATQTIVDDIRLSTGQRQRLLLARALAHSPRLLVLDEALSAVPDAMKECLIDRIRARGLSAVIVTHDTHLVALADRVCLLEQGRLTYDGAPEHLLESASYRRIFDLEERDE